jgi:hypothetical protein
MTFLDNVRPLKAQVLAFKHRIAGTAGESCIYSLLILPTLNPLVTNISQLKMGAFRCHTNPVANSGDAKINPLLKS